MDLKRNDSVMHVAFLHSETGLIITVSAVVGLKNKIWFTFNSTQHVPFLESQGLVLPSVSLL